MKYPDYNTYTKLYGRYLRKSVQPFFDGVNITDKRVLDLCAGGGQLAQYAVDNGAKQVVLVDEAPQMLNPQFNGKGKTIHINENVVYYLKDFGQGLAYVKNGGGITHFKDGYTDEQFDIVVARQAINYWFNWVTGEDIAKVIKKGGSLIFNTFGNKPSETPKAREYFHGGVAYAEISYLIGDTIHHVQTAQGMEPHMTEFKWISSEDFQKKLSPYFIIKEVTDGPSSMWYCQKV